MRSNKIFVQGLMWIMGLGFVMVTLMPSCKPLQKSIAVHPPVQLYNPGKSVLHPEYKIFHSDENESTLYFRILISELIFNQANPELKERAQVRISWILYSSLKDNQIAAKDTLDFFVYKDFGNEAFVGSLKFPAQTNQTYVLDIVLEDALRNTRTQDLLLVDRFSQHPQQDYLILEYPGNTPGFHPYYYSDEKFRIIHRQISGGQIYVSRFPLRNTLPLPPYSDEVLPEPTFLPDTTIASMYSQQYLSQIDVPGIYIYHFEQYPVSGLCLVNFSDHFPQINQPSDMLPPLQYITTKEEYLGLVSHQDLKQSLDDFWLGKGKTYPNARDLIRVYYTRVLFANHYFTGSKEGWKTDRGMIYVIMGPPNEVIRTETDEIWAYSAVDNNQRYVFRFSLKSDPYIGFDYVLNRSENHRNVWNMAVNTWRQGKIFSL